MDNQDKSPQSMAASHATACNVCMPIICSWKFSPNHCGAVAETVENVSAAGRILSPSWPSASKAALTIKSTAAILAATGTQCCWRHPPRTALPGRKLSRILACACLCFPHCRSGKSSRAHTYTVWRILPANGAREPR
jgi:hypothetical protein